MTDISELQSIQYFTKPLNYHLSASVDTELFVSANQIKDITVRQSNNYTKGRHVRRRISMAHRLDVFIYPDHHTHLTPLTLIRWSSWTRDRISQSADLRALHWPSISSSWWDRQVQYALYISLRRVNILRTSRNDCFWTWTKRLGSTTAVRKIKLNHSMEVPHLHSNETCQVTHQQR